MFVKENVPEELLKKRWIVYPDPDDKENHLQVEDVCIITDENEEVLGSSEWLRCDRKILNYIVKSHNEKLGL